VLDECARYLSGVRSVVVVHCWYVLLLNSTLGLRIGVPLVWKLRKNYTDRLHISR
jgi:hypothetical protein